MALMDATVAAGGRPSDALEGLFIAACLRIAAANEGGYVPTPEEAAALFGSNGALWNTVTSHRCDLGRMLSGRKSSASSCRTWSVRQLSCLVKSNVTTPVIAKSLVATGPALTRMEADVTTVVRGDTACISALHVLKVIGADSSNSYRGIPETSVSDVAVLCKQTFCNLILSIVVCFWNSHSQNAVTPFAAGVRAAAGVRSALRPPCLPRHGLFIPAGAVYVLQMTSHMARFAIQLLSQVCCAPAVSSPASWPPPS